MLISHLITSMDVKIIKVGFLRTNCYILTINNDCLVIDPGAEANKIIDYISNHNLNLLALLITHYHNDHIGGLNDLLNYKEVEIYDYKLKEQSYQIGSFNFDIIYTKGHTNDSITFYFKDNKMMFVGDFIFQGTVGRTDIGGNMDDMLKSIDMIKYYPNDITIYPGHENRTTLGIEKEENEFFL